MRKMRRLKIQRLESRMLMHGDAAPDVNLDGDVTAGDALAVINHIAEYGQAAVPFSNLDANRDGFVTVVDALVVINHIAEPEPAHTIGFRIGPIDAYTLTEDEVRWAIASALADFEEHTPGLEWRVTESGTYRIASREIQIGGRAHARGQQVGNTAWFHNGWVSDNPAHPTPYQWDGFWNGNPNGLRKIIRHEIYHIFFGRAHSGDINCVMHINASADDFCQSEINAITRRF